MKVVSSKVTKLTITEVNRLDTIEVFAEDIAPRKGTITIKCYGQSWTAYWGGMGTGTLAEFICSMDEHYLANCLSPGISHTVPDTGSALVDLLRKEVIQRRRKGILQRPKARELYDRAGYPMLHDNAPDSALIEECVDSYCWWDHIPRKANADYGYLCRIITTVQAALATSKTRKVVRA